MAPDPETRKPPSLEGKLDDEDIKDARNEDVVEPEDYEEAGIEEITKENEVESGETKVERESPEMKDEESIVVSEELKQKKRKEEQEKLQETREGIKETHTETKESLDKLKKMEGSEKVKEEHTGTRESLDKLEKMEGSEESQINSSQNENQGFFSKITSGIENLFSSSEEKPKGYLTKKERERAETVKKNEQEKWENAEDELTSSEKKELKKQRQEIVDQINEKLVNTDQEAGESTNEMSFGDLNLSIQAGKQEYSKPKSDNANFYSEVELGYPSKEPPEYIMKYAEDPDRPTETAYPYVPIELVARWVSEEKSKDSNNLKRTEKEKQLFDSIQDLIIRKGPEVDISKEQLDNMSLEEAVDFANRYRGELELTKEEEEELEKLKSAEIIDRTKEDNKNTTDEVNKEASLFSTKQDWWDSEKELEGMTEEEKVKVKKEVDEVVQNWEKGPKTHEKMTNFIGDSLNWLAENITAPIAEPSKESQDINIDEKIRKESVSELKDELTVTEWEELKKQGLVKEEKNIGDYFGNALNSILNKGERIIYQGPKN